MTVYYEMDDVELYNHVFGPGKIIIVHGRLGTGKTTTQVRIMESLCKLKYKTVLHNIQFHYKNTRPGSPELPKKMKKIWTMTEMLREIATPRAKWFANAPDELRWEYQEAKVPESLPTFMATLDEAKDFLDKMRNGDHQAIQFIKKFVPAIRKLGVGIGLIYHGKDETVKDLREKDGGQFLAGELFCPTQGTIELHLKEELYPQLFDDNYYDGMDAPFGEGPIEITGIKKTNLLMDSFHTATFTIDEGMDIGDIWRKLARYTSDEAPAELLKILDDMEKPIESGDGFPIDNREKLGAWLLDKGNWRTVQQKMQSKNRKYSLTQDDISNIVDAPKSTITGNADKLYENWRQNFEKNR